jgi:penicillin-binding protein 1C
MTFRSRRLLLVVVTVLLVLPVGYARLAPLDDPEARSVVPGTVVLDVHGTVLEHDAADGLRIPVALDAVAPVMLRATVSAEDRRFWQHPGIDPLAALRALSRMGTQPSGASTITQQLARRLYLTDDAASLPIRKAREAVIALQLEGRRSKSELLALYLNDVYYGRGAYGVEAAARMFFGISAANLDLAHASYLAGLPQRPSTYDSADDALARARQSYVLARMVEDGAVSRAEAEAARVEPIGLLPAGRSPPAHAFVTFALAELARVRPDLAGRAGLTIETTLDAALQAEVERLARLRLAELKDRNVTDAALVAIEPGTGRIVAMLGGATDGDPAHGGEINMALSPRQPGSALKPFLYASAFEHGYTPASALLDVPTAFAALEGPYRPLNFDRSFHGVVPLRVALASSLNVPAVRTLDALGMNAMLEMVHRFGLATLSQTERYGLSLTLGGGEVPLLDLTSAYAALGAGGALREPFAVVRVRDAGGRVIYERAHGAARRVLSTEHAYLLADILSDGDARVPGFGGVTPFDVPFPAAVKSGTSTGFRDTWTIGYTPEIAIGVWAGNADGSPMIDVAGVEGAGPIWRDAMMAAALARSMSWYERPAGIVETTVCAPTGLLPGSACQSPVRELFVAGTQPVTHESYYVRDGDGRIAVNPPVEARAWAREAGLALTADGLVATDNALRVVAPAAGTIYWLAPELSAQRVLFRASASPGVETITFELDGVVIGRRPADDPSVLWDLAPGRHTLRVSAPGLAPVTSTFEVKR